MSTNLPAPHPGDEMRPAAPKDAADLREFAHGVGTNAAWDAIKWAFWTYWKYLAGAPPAIAAGKLGMPLTYTTGVLTVTALMLLIGCASGVQRYVRLRRAQRRAALEHPREPHSLPVQAPLTRPVLRVDAASLVVREERPVRIEVEVDLLSPCGTVTLKKVAFEIDLDSPRARDGKPVSLHLSAGTAVCTLKSGRNDGWGGPALENEPLSNIPRHVFVSFIPLNQPAALQHLFEDVTAGYRVSVTVHLVGQVARGDEVEDVAPDSARFSGLRREQGE